jgi:hypothetical protein
MSPAREKGCAVSALNTILKAGSFLPVASLLKQRKLMTVPLSTLLAW